MSYRGMALSAIFLGVLAFCTEAAANSLDLITNETLKAYTESELESGAPSIPVTSRILYRDALQLLHDGEKKKAVQELQLAADLTGDYAAPLFTLARVELFSANPDLAAIVMDACVPGDKPTTPPLVWKFRQSFTGPIIAVSSSRVFREQLKAAGCDHACEKEDVPQELLRILQIK